MAHFAEIDENNIVLRVIVVDNNLESIGSEWCSQTFGGNWIQTSYNNKIRKNFAGIGYTYNPVLDAFIPPKPENSSSWVLDETTCQWIPPIPKPTVPLYEWNEEQQQWVLVN
jgi:hypothetical protein